MIAPSIVQRFHQRPARSASWRRGSRVGILTVPLVASVAEDARPPCPARCGRQLRHGRQKTAPSARVVVPAAVSGLVAAFILAVSRAIGETMVVFIAAGAAGGQLPLEPAGAGPHDDRRHGVAGQRHRSGEGRASRAFRACTSWALLFVFTLRAQHRGRPVRTPGPAGVLMAASIATDRREVRARSELALRRRKPTSPAGSSKPRSCCRCSSSLLILSCPPLLRCSSSVAGALRRG